MTPEHRRLEEDESRAKNWKRWGPYLSERQWGTVREDYSPDGAAWEYYPFEHAHLRAPRWGEDGLLGICDRQCRLCFALALWNGRDPILKERLFGVTNHQGNHGEDVKEEYYYLDGTPTHSYLKGRYHYPVAAYPYEELIAGNKKRSRNELEFELHDTDAFADGFFAVELEMAKADDDDLLFRVTIVNESDTAQTLHVLPTLWFRNRWSWGQLHEGLDAGVRPSIERSGEHLAVHAPDLGPMSLTVDEAPRRFLFTENETNRDELFGVPNEHAHTREAFHCVVVDGREEAAHPHRGTKAAAWYAFELSPGASRVIHLRLKAGDPAPARDDEAFAARMAETEAFYDAVHPPHLQPEQRRVARQAYAGLLWTKQFYHYIVKDWKEGDALAAPPATRNLDWDHLYARDIISMPDKWEYPWFAAWDLAFHMLPFADIDPAFAREQLTIFLREWYMHPNGQIPAYEWNFGDVNPPVHAWACLQVFRRTGRTERSWLASCFQKLLLNFTWWVNRKDENGNNLFSGGFLGLDNIGVFDRSHGLPDGALLHQADGTAWMGFYSLTMLEIALELAIEEDRVRPEYGDMASKFFEHFMQICEAINEFEGDGLWCENDEFYYDELVEANGQVTMLRIRSLVGLMPLIAASVLEADVLQRLPGFHKRFQWFIENRTDLSHHIAFRDCPDGKRRWLLAIAEKPKLKPVLSRMFDEKEFLSPHGIRGLSKWHENHPFTLRVGGEVHRVAYTPAESDTGLFGGNSNWRGPVWFPINYLLADVLQTYHRFYGDELRIAYPTGSGREQGLDEVARDLHRRLASLFLPDASGHRPSHGGDPRYADDPRYRDLILFYEYFHGDTGRGLGASHQTGWTALVANCLEES